MAIEILTSTVTLSRPDSGGETQLHAVIELRTAEDATLEGAGITIRLRDADRALVGTVSQALLPLAGTGPHLIEASGNLRLAGASVATAECEIQGGVVEEQTFTPTLEGWTEEEAAPAQQPPVSTATDDPWSAMAAGTGEAPDGLARTRLLGRARRAATSPDLAERLDGVRVARAIGGREGLEVVSNFLKDPDPEVRRAAFDTGVDAREAGLVIVRAAAGAPDPAIATEAMSHLAAIHDRSSTTRARTLLRHDSPRVRAAAAKLLGIIAGRTLRPTLADLLSDPDGEVRVAAANAVATLDGERPPPAKRGWWEPAPQGEEAALDASRPAALPARPSDASPGAPQIDLAALLEELGAAPEEKRPEVLRRLADLDPRDVMVQIRLVRTSSPQDVARGAAIAVGELGLERLVSHTRQLLRHPAAPVRTAAVEALGQRAAVGILPSMSPLLRDGDSEVRCAAAVALATAGAHTGRASLVSGWLDAITDEDPAMVAAVQRAREILSP